MLQIIEDAGRLIGAFERASGPADTNAALADDRRCHGFGL